MFHPAEQLDDPRARGLHHGPPGQRQRHGGPGLREGRPDQRDPRSFGWSDRRGGRGHPGRGRRAAQPARPVPARATPTRCCPGARRRTADPGAGRRPEPAACADRLGSSPAWLRGLRRDARGPRPVSTGHRDRRDGTGKFTLVAELYHADHPAGRSIVVDAAQLGDGRRRRDPDAMLASDPGTDAVHRPEHRPGRAPGRGALDDGVQRPEPTPAPATFVATLSDSSLDSDLPFHALLGHFEVAVDRPAAAAADQDLRPIADRLLAEIAPGRSVRLTPEPHARHHVGTRGHVT